jgi:hypothetical protein
MQEWTKSEMLVWRVHPGRVFGDKRSYVTCMTVAHDPIIYRSYGLYKASSLHVASPFIHTPLIPGSVDISEQCTSSHTTDACFSLRKRKDICVLLSLTVRTISSRHQDAIIGELQQLVCAASAGAATATPRMG